MEEYQDIKTENNENSNGNLNEENEDKSSFSSALVRWLKYRSKSVRFIVTLTIVFIVIILVGISVYFCWFKWMMPVIVWGFNPIRFTGIIAFFGIVFLSIMPFFPFVILEEILGKIININADDLELEFQKKNKELENKRILYENKLSETDRHLLIPLITYSKIELETYYKIGLNQTQKSFKYSIISMWIGFLLIVAGIIVFIIPIPQINQTYLQDTGLKTLTVASGIITEIISVLFLWIYKNSITQLTYFYNRQINIHNALFTFRIAETMTNSDNAKTIIIEKLLQNIIEIK